VRNGFTTVENFDTCSLDYICFPPLIHPILGYSCAENQQLNKGEKKMIYAGISFIESPPARPPDAAATPATAKESTRRAIAWQYRR
jgi:hypothetical protein